MTVKLKLIYLICMILCVFLTFSTVNATDLNHELIIDESNEAAILSQSESSMANLNENANDIDYYNEDEDCVDSMIELFNSSYQKDMGENKNSPISSDSLNSINSDEKSLKSSLGYINSHSLNVNSSAYGENSFKSDLLKANSYSFNDIQNLINNASAGSTINLEGKTYIGNGSLITINKPITINGGSSSNMATFDAKKLSEIFQIRSNNVHILNCNFINGINRTLYLSVNNSSVSNCNFKDNFYHLYVTVTSENLSIEYCNFTDAYANDTSSVIVKANRTYVSYCNFINNFVENIGDVQGHGAALQIGRSANATNIGFVNYCNFINNTVITNSHGTHAGALCFRPGIVVSNSNFINNYCNVVGGATTLHSDGEIINCTFINNSAGKYGGAISTGLDSDDISVNIINCTFINNSAPMGGAIQIKGNNVKVIDSIFEGNKANESEGGAVFIVGNDALLINSTFKNNFAETVGAGVLINGSDAGILNSSFDNNIADYGAAVYVVGPNAKLFSSNFTNHDVKNGSVYINGVNTYVYDSNFLNNLGEAGAGLFIEGSNTTLILSNFSGNNANQKGGAVYIDGSNAKLILSAFLKNNAIPNMSQLENGLGGAIYIKGDNNLIDSSIFNFNTARNGSAIYTDGLNMTLSNTDFDKNQAWSYVLDSTVNPLISYFNESDILVNLTLIGGNNIANAIYNTASIDEIFFYNVSYISSKGPKWTGNDEIHPVDGAENSNNGSLLYQDDREDNQLVNVIIYRESSSDEFIASPFLKALDDDFLSHYEIILNETFRTGILGDIRFNLSDYIGSPLKSGKYHIYAEHLEDDYYKGIDETNEFDIVPILDLAIDIGSSRVNVDFNKTVKFTIKVKNNGPNDASEVNVNALIPEGLIYLSSSPSIGTYDSDSGIWHIGNLDSGANQTLIINVQTNKTGFIDYPVNVSSLEDDYNMTNNYDNKTIRVLMADLAITVNASEDIANYGEIVNWAITVVNNGPNNASKIVVLLNYSDDELIYLESSNSSFNSSNNKLEIPSLLVGDGISFEISTKVNVSNKTINLNATVSSDTYDSIKSNNFDLDSVNALPLCDLITKLNVSQSSVNKDDIVDWIVLVCNDGPDDACDVVVSLSDLESLGLIVLNTSDDSFDLDSLEWFIGDLAHDNNVSLIITTQVDNSNDEISLVGEVETSTLESDYDNNIDNASLVISPLCDLKIDIEVSNDTANYGDIVDWIVLVCNDGPDDACDVVVSLSDLESLGLIVLNTSDDSFDLDSLEWFIGDLDAGNSVSLSISTKANKSNEEITVIADVETSTFESNKENNHDNESLNLLPFCDIAVTIVPDNYQSYVNDNVNWIINVTNIGPDKANEVNVFNGFPENLEFIDFESNKGELEYVTDDEGNILDLIWKVGELEKNESALLVITTRSIEEGTVLNNVSANSSTSDINQSNNFDSASIEVIPFNESADDDSQNPDETEGNEDNQEDNSNNYTDDFSDDYEDYDDFSWYDYLSDDFNGNGNDKNADDNSYAMPKIHNIKNLKAIDISNKKTGNPFVLLVLSILVFFSLFYGKD